MAENTETLKYVFEGEVKSLQKATTRAMQSIDKYFKHTTSVTSALSKAFAGLTSIKLGDWFADATKQSIAYVENLNLFTVAMGDAIEEGIAFVGTMQELYGMDPSSLMQHVGNFYQLADAIDMPTEAATTMSLSLTKATNDIASLFNVNVSTVFENLASGMQGMSRAVRKYGMDIRATTLQQTALSLGIKDQVENMSEANRMGLRYLTMMKQASNATGDFARTIETPANQLRILQEQMAQLGRAIGSFIIGPLGVAVQYINGFVMALRTALTFLASMLGITEDVGRSLESTGDGSETFDDIASSVDGATKKMKKFLAPFDELTVLQDEASSATGTNDLTMDPAILEAIANMNYGFEQVRMKANQVRDAILEFLGFEVDMGQILRWDASQFEENLINKFPQWTKTIEAVFANWSAIASALGSVFNSIGGVFELVFARLQSVFQGVDWDTTIADFINGLSTNLYSLSAWIDEHAEGLADLVISLGAVVLALKALPGVVGVLGTIGTLLSPAFTALSGLLSLLAPVGAAFSSMSIIAVAAVTAVIAVLAALWVTSETFRDSVLNAVDSIRSLLETFWDSTLKPILESVASSLKSLWQNGIKPVIEQVISIIGHLIEIVLNLWSNVLEPIVEFLVQEFGPKIAAVFDAVWTAISSVIESVMKLFDGLLQMLDGVLEFLAGVFAGNIEQVGRGIGNFFVGLANTIISAIEFAVNAVIGLINILVSAVHTSVVNLVNSILGTVEDIAEFLGHDISLKVSAKPPSIPKASWPRFPAMARGGVVTSPTMALIGEGGRDEAVIPLDNSPQMTQLVQQIADAVRDIPRGGGFGSSNQPIEVRVFLDSREITSAQNRNNRMYGKNTQNV